MTPRVIYHDFRQESSSVFAPEPGSTVLTASVLNKGRRLLKFTARVSSVVTAACIFLCGACTAAGLLVLLLLSMGG